MATLHLLVGLPCSGKTTLAKKLETKHSALRLTPDEWHISLFGQDYGSNMTEAEETTHDARHEAVESLMWKVAARTLTLGVDVILDFGFWTQIEREEFRSRAKELGVNFKIHYVEVSENRLFERLKSRNAQNPDETFLIPEEKLKEWMRIFEPPSTEELKK